MNVIFFGYQLGPTMDEERVKIILDNKRPQNLENLIGFLINYFMKLVPDLNENELPVINLLRKGVHFK